MNILGGSSDGCREPSLRRRRYRAKVRGTRSGGHRLHSSGTEPVPQSQHRGEPLHRPFSRAHPRPALHDRRAARATAPANCSPQSTSNCRRRRRSAAFAGERQLVEIAKALGSEARAHHLRRADDLVDDPRDGHGSSRSSIGCGARASRSSTSATSSATSCGSATTSWSCATARWSGPRATIDVDHRSMISLMVGRTIDQLFPPREAARGGRRAGPGGARCLAARHRRGHLLHPAARRGARAVRLDGRGPLRAGAHPLRPRPL